MNNSIGRPSLHQQVLVWFFVVVGIIGVTLVLFIQVGSSLLGGFALLLDTSHQVYQLQDSLEEERKAFSDYLREDSQQNYYNYLFACQRTKSAIDRLPKEYAAIGEERYARTWNLTQGYQGYAEARDALLQLEPSAPGYSDRLYEIRNMQESLSVYALRLSQAALEWNSSYHQRSTAYTNQLPWFFAVVVGLCVLMLVRIIRLLSRRVVQPLFSMATAARQIAANVFSSPDLPVEHDDEVGNLMREFNRMKHSMVELLNTQEALHQEELSKVELEKDLNYIRLEMLKAQVNPHFLFNTLNMISCMAQLEEAPTSSRMTLALSNLFRYNLRTKEQEVYLDQELQTLDDYLYIQQMRFENRISLRKILHVDPSEVKIPSFTLQPLVENAFLHGLGHLEENGRVTLRIWQEGSRLIISIADNGKGMTAQELANLHRKMQRSEATGKGIGLGNISRRIQMLYPSGGITIYSKPARGTVVQLTMEQT